MYLRLKLKIFLLPWGFKTGTTRSAGQHLTCGATRASGSLNMWTGEIYCYEAVLDQYQLLFQTQETQRHVEHLEKELHQFHTRHAATTREVRGKTVTKGEW